MQKKRDEIEQKNVTENCQKKNQEKESNAIFSSGNKNSLNVKVDENRI